MFPYFFHGPPVYTSVRVMEQVCVTSPSNFLTLQLLFLSTLAKILALHQSKVISVPINKKRVGLLKSIELENLPQLSTWLLKLDVCNFSVRLNWGFYVLLTNCTWKKGHVWWGFF